MIPSFRRFNLICALHALPAIGFVLIAGCNRQGACEDLVQKKCVEMPSSDCSSARMHSSVVTFQPGETCIHLGYPSSKSGTATPWGDLAGAARQGDLARVTEVIQKHPELATYVDDLGKTALHYAATGGNLQVAEFILSKHARVDIKDKSGKTPLQCAIEANDSSMEKLLRSHFAH